jgi:hypothetical protein
MNYHLEGSVKRKDTSDNISKLSSKKNLRYFKDWMGQEQICAYDFNYSEKKNS